MLQEHFLSRKNRTRVVDLLASDGPRDRVRAMGWARSVRVSKGVTFIALNDGSCFGNLQVVVPADAPCFDTARRLTTGSSLVAEGALVASPGQQQQWELHAIQLVQVGAADETYPLQKKRHSLEFLRSIAHLRPRANTFGAVFRVRNTLANAIHRFFQERGFSWVHTPIISSSDCEGAGEMFRVTTLDIDALAGSGKPQVVDCSQDFFGRRTGLTVSGQLEAELLALALSDVYTFGPTFRAENSNTSRHVAEFWMIEPEMAFADLADDIQLAEDFLRSITREVMEKSEEDLRFFAERIEPRVPERLKILSDSRYEVMTYREAVKHLQNAAVDFEYPVHFGADLQAEHERYLAEQLVGGPVFVTDYPKTIKAFYMRLNDDEETVAATDLLVPQVGEIIGGSQREERLDVLEQRIRDQGLHIDDYWWYLDVRRYGTVPHAGFGLGFDRLLMYLTGMTNIRDVIPFPRTPGHAEF